MSAPRAGHPTEPSPDDGIRNASPDLRLEPPIARWPALAAAERARADHLFDRPLPAWRTETRRELALDPLRPIIATGHQPLLWHPGILVKYFAVDAALSLARGACAGADLIVDQHEGGFAELDVPVREAGGGLLSVRRLTLLRARPGVPMALHPAADVLPGQVGSDAALRSVGAGVRQIVASLSAHRAAPDAAAQMAGALADLRSPWCARMPAFRASDLVASAFGRRFIRAMVDDPWTCAQRYNDAVRAVPEAGLPPLLIRDDLVELPLWRVGADGVRQRAFDADAGQWLAADASAAPSSRLLPRALLLTALVRLAAVDLFVHGTGGAVYDRAMESWVTGWLGVRPAPFAVATATLRLPLQDPAAHHRASIAQEMAAAAHRTWHDPEPAPARDAPGPGEVKRLLLSAIEAAPRGSRRRRAAYRAMHEQLAMLRSRHIGRVEAAQRRARAAQEARADAVIAARRDWAFPLYEPASLAALADAVRAAAVDVDARS
ncbi:MAG: hypothetical protein KF817_10980 [Phycisphaeraceae bacterium]|nr:hypothetical protein [Phycisphaeraceae bacterium]